MDKLNDVFLQHCADVLASTNSPLTGEQPKSHLLEMLVVRPHWLLQMNKIEIYNISLEIWQRTD